MHEKKFPLESLASTGEELKRGTNMNLDSEVWANVAYSGLMRSTRIRAVEEVLVGLEYAR